MLNKIINVIKNLNSKSFDLLIFFVTNKCNLACKTCFYWRKVNKGGDLNFEQLKRIIRNIPKFKQLIISGGEPFLREDLQAVIQEFIDNCGIIEVDIPTNGLLAKKIFVVTQEIASQNPNTKFVISFSWDGLERINKTIRTGTNDQNTVIDIIKKLVNLSDSYKNLEIQINTVICKENYLAIPDFLKYLEEQGYLGVKRHLFEIIRGDPREEDESKFTVSEFSSLKDILIKIIAYQDKMFKNNLKSHNLLMKYILAGFNYANLLTIYKIQYNFFTSRKKWQFPCASAFGMTAVIEHDGDVKLCELRKAIGNIKEENFNAIFYNQEAKNERNAIINNRCSCSHICFIYPSLYQHKRIVFLRLPFEYLKYVFGVKAW